MSQRGSTMLEMMGVLGIIGILGAGVWKLIDSAMFKYRVSTASISLQSLEKGIFRFYSVTGNYDDLSKTTTLAKLISNNIVPKEMKRSNNTIGHPFSGSEGSVEIKNIVEQAGVPSISFSITYKDLSKKACLEMATVSWPESDLANLLSIQVGTTKYVWPNYKDEASTDKTLPVDVSDVLNDCMDAPVDITWVFR